MQISVTASYCHACPRGARGNGVGHGFTAASIHLRGKMTPESGDGLLPSAPIQLLLSAEITTGVI